MRILKLIFFLAPLCALMGCNQNKENELKKELSFLETKLSEVEEERDEALNRVRELINEISELKDLNEELQSEIVVLEVKLQFEEKQLDFYKYGRGLCSTRYWKGIGQKTICGADNIIDMLEKDYCIWDCKYNGR